jgi:membrane-bound lytic murein transglycosylase D
VVNTVFTTVPSGRTFYHTVGRGESMSSIARRYGVSAEDLRRWNGVVQNAVRPGQRLRVTSDVVTGGKAPKRAAGTPKRVTGTLPPARGGDVNGAPARPAATSTRKR